jgi:hypothetical protein
MTKLLLPPLTFLCFSNYPGQQQFWLATFMQNYIPTFFAGSATASLKFAQPATQIFYTQNNVEPNEKYKVYQSCIVLKKSLTTFKTKVFGNGFLLSEVVHAEPLHSIPESHPGKGTQAWLFIDEIKTY